MANHINDNSLTAAAHDPIDYHEWSGSLVQMNEPDYSCTYDYDLNGKMTLLTRHGVNVKVNVSDVSALINIILAIK